MKKFTYFITGVLVSAGINIVFAISNIDPSTPLFNLSQKPVIYKTIPISATSTEYVSIPSSYTYTFDSSLSNQGVCFKIKDSDGIGYTYVTYNNGSQVVSSQSCE